MTVKTDVAQQLHGYHLFFKYILLMTKIPDVNMKTWLLGLSNLRCLQRNPTVR